MGDTTQRRHAADAGPAHRERDARGQPGGADEAGAGRDAGAPDAAGVAAQGRVLRRYVVAASAARTADEGLGPALVLLVAGAGRDPAFAGVLLAAAGLPHVVAGPFAGAALDRAPRRRVVLALAPAVFGIVLAGAALGLGRAPDAACVALAALAGCAGPLLTGGMSAELTQLVPERTGRALALDGASYNLAAIAGPGVVAGGAALAGAEWAALALGALAFAAAAVVLRLPASRPAGRHARPWRAGLGGARRLWDARPLRLVTAGTTLAFAGAGALPLIVIARADELGSATSGAALLGAMAVAALAGSLLSAAADAPDGGMMRGTTWGAARHRAARAVAGGAPERRVVRALAAVAAGLAIAGAGGGMVTLGAGLALAGVADGLLLPAILAVRTRYSAPHERGAVFTTAASVKVTAGAAGAAVGGLLVTAAGAGPALLAAAALHILGALVCARYRAAS